MSLSPLAIVLLVLIIQSWIREEREATLTALHHELHSQPPRTPPPLRQEIKGACIVYGGLLLLCALGAFCAGVVWLCLAPLFGVDVAAWLQPLEPIVTPLLNGCALSTGAVLLVIVLCRLSRLLRPPAGRRWLWRFFCEPGGFPSLHELSLTASQTSTSVQPAAPPARLPGRSGPAD